MINESKSIIGERSKLGIGFQVESSKLKKIAGKFVREISKVKLFEVSVIRGRNGSNNNKNWNHGI